MEKTKEARVLDMTGGNSFRLLLVFAMPLFMGNLLQQLYNLADTAIAGHLLGDSALAQIGVTSALYSLLTNFAFGMNNGLALSVSRSFGAGNQKRLRQSVCWMTILSTSFAFLMMILFLLLRSPILVAMQVPEDTLQPALQYFTIILLGIPFTMAYNMESAMLQSVGNSIAPLFFLLASSILNVILDILFMGPFHFGIRGAAAATILSQAVSALLAFILILKRYPQLHFSAKDRHTGKDFVAGMLGAGMSMALMSAIYNIGSVVLQGSINALGNLYITAQVGGRKLAELFYIPGIALGTSTATYVSQNVGAGRRSRIGRGMLSAIALYGAWWIIALLFTIFGAEDAVRMITGSDNSEVIRNGALYLQISIPMIPPMAVLVIVRNGLQGMGHSVSPLICSSLELIGKVVFALFVVPVYGYFAVCICEPVTWVVCCIFILVFLFLTRSELKDTTEGDYLNETI